MQNFLSCDISKGAVVKRLLINKLLAIPTFGLYRFWGKTHLRRLLWQSMRIGEDRLTYHGTAKELFIGFLIVMVILMVVFGVIGTFLQFLVMAGPVTGAISQVLYTVLLLMFWQFARYRLWRYRLSRTSYRTIRFYQMGSAITYTLKSLGWGLLAAVTLGWMYPKMRYELTKYRVDNMAFGDQSFHFEGQSSEFYRIYWPAILAFNAYLIVPLAISAMDGFLFDALNTGSAVAASEPAIIAAMVVGFGLILVTGAFWIIARVKEFNYTTIYTSFAGANFAADLPVSAVVRKILAVGLIVIGIPIVLALLYFAFVSVLIGSIYGGFHPVAIVMVVLPVLLMFLFLEVIIFIFFYIPLVRSMSQHIYVSNVEVFSDVAAASHDSPKYGEGLADALDVGAF